MLKRKKKFLQKRYIAGLGFIILIVGIVIAYNIYDKIYSSNIELKDKEYDYLYIPTGATKKDVLRIIDASDRIQNMDDFKWLAEKKNYYSHINPGRYQIKEGMSNNALINKLRAGRQDPVDVIFNNIRLKPELAGVVSKQIEADSVDILQLINDRDFLGKYEFTPQTVPAMFIPNTYEFYWNTSARKFIERMHGEFHRFWDGEKNRKAEDIGLTPVEVTTLASIVEEETTKEDEMPKIAGVYMNRLDLGMRLQADPTIKFAIGDFSVNRILDKYLEIDSPYNTYKYAGLPPGPISFPPIAAIEAVLNYENHDYLYFAAKPDFSGYHNFSRTHRQHIINARKYQKALNERKIME